MNPLSAMTSSTETGVEVLEKPITATLRSSVFEVRCEATEAWLTSAYNSSCYSDEDKKKEIKENLKQAEYRFHKAKEEYGVLVVTPPVGFWLSDGRLVSTEYNEGERVKAYYGEKEEILGMGRKIVHIKDSLWTFLPVG